MKTKMVRPPAVAGMFYPSRADTLRMEVERYIAHGHTPKPLPTTKALIAPHAGYPYSGPVAGSAYACVAGHAATISRVIILGPSHRVAFNGVACSGAGAFNTPLGEVPVDQQANHEISALPFVSTNDRAHRDEHSLEVHLPFLQCALDEFDIVPLVVGNASAQMIHRLLDILWGNKETLIVISSDLSHYLPYEDARRIDRITSDAIEQLAPEKIDFNQACGALPVQGLLLAAKQRGLKASTVDLRNSGDTAGDKTSVVGYGAYVFA